MPDQTEPDLNAVVIERVIADDGSVKLNVGATGDVRVTEIGDVLANALKLHRLEQESR
jgi:hypothetical protein